nr:MAG: replication initiator protein [Microvirus sp.]
MPCYHPLKAFRNDANESRPTIHFNPHIGQYDIPLRLPCGQCIGCRLDRSRQWAIRCVHEAQLHEKNCFLTLTYSDDHLPEGGSLRFKDFQDFMKRLRKRMGPVRFFHCGEYGEKLSRPHYHACLFGLDFHDKYLWKENRGFPIYRSPILEELWPFGHSSIGAVTFESAAYVARYITKKITGKNAADHYERLDEYGEYRQLDPEYTTMSRRPGIGSKWFAKYVNDVYPSDQVILAGKKLKPPRFYDNLFDLSCPEEMEGIKFNRTKKAKLHAADQSPERLRDREFIQEAKLQQLIRDWEKIK